MFTEVCLRVPSREIPRSVLAVRHPGEIMSVRDGTNALTHEAFAALGNRIRMDMLRVLWFQRELTFSEFFDRVDVEDSGHFTYHLNELLDHFVYKAGEHYKVTNAGKEIVTTILAHVETDNPLRTPYHLSTECYGCGSTIAATSSRGWLRIECPECEKLYSSFPIPLSGLNDRSPADVLSVFDHRVRQIYGSLHRALCPNCFCPTTRAIVHDAEPPPGLPFVFRHRCSHCRVEIYSLPGTGLLESPAVISFYDRHGRDLFAIPHWELDWLFDGRRITVLEEESLTYHIDITVADDRLRVTLESGGTLKDSEVEAIDTGTD